MNRAELREKVAEWTDAYAGRIYRAGRKPPYADTWNYENGTMLHAIYRLYQLTGDERHFGLVREQVDRYVTEDGAIRTYERTDYNLDQINMGRLLFPLYERTGREKYAKAIRLLSLQLEKQPRTTEGGYWHKRIYPRQMWLDGLYMAGPFRCMLAAAFGSGRPEEFDDIAIQFELMERHARDPKTGLLYHGWDESREQAWADRITGCSPHFWSRSIGWYMMALADSLERFPAGHVGKSRLAAMLERLVSAVTVYQDAETGMWHQITDAGGREGNYAEASGTAMFVYAILKGIRLGVVPSVFEGTAERGFAGLLRHAARADADGTFRLCRINRVAGLGGHPYRDGSFAYYVGEPVVCDDPKGVAPFLLAAMELAF
ncbi:glycoside hydrolase family 88 protein [Cohnella algarum]|uniref:glycoside hydrolase family 88 protein n=1 Tax=Cohnella algarum TaxID=2044859 RepID=UPI0019675EAC|nr:glycoside hydrolase family 88 protein [Cohnella algarum]